MFAVEAREGNRKLLLELMTICSIPNTCNSRKTERQGKTSSKVRVVLVFVFIEMLDKNVGSNTVQLYTKAEICGEGT